MIRHSSDSAGRKQVKYRNLRIGGQHHSPISFGFANIELYLKLNLPHTSLLTG